MNEMGDSIIRSAIEIVVNGKFHSRKYYHCLNVTQEIFPAKIPLIINFAEFCSGEFHCCYFTREDSTKENYLVQQCISSTAHKCHNFVNFHDTKVITGSSSVNVYT